MFEDGGYCYNPAHNRGDPRAVSAPDARREAPDRRAQWLAGVEALVVFHMNAYDRRTKFGQEWARATLQLADAITAFAGSAAEKLTEDIALARATDAILNADVLCADYDKDGHFQATCRACSRNAAAAVLAALAPPDSVRDTLAHALFDHHDVGLYGGDGFENAWRIAGEMLAAYDWPWPGAGGPAELGNWLAKRAETEVEALRAMYQPALGPEERVRQLETVLRLVLAQMATVADSVDGKILAPYREREENVVAIVRSALRGSVPGGSPTGERE